MSRMIKRVAKPAGGSMAALGESQKRKEEQRKRCGWYQAEPQETKTQANT